LPDKQINTYLEDILYFYQVKRLTLKYDAQLQVRLLPATREFDD